MLIGFQSHSFTMDLFSCKKIIIKYISIFQYKEKMSLVFRIKSVHMKEKSDDECKEWLEERNLKSHYGNLKCKKFDNDGFTEFK